MNLDQTFCACDCQADKCDRQLTYSVARAAEKRGNKPLAHADFSDQCEKYISLKESEE